MPSKHSSTAAQSRQKASAHHHRHHHKTSSAGKRSHSHTQAPSAEAAPSMMAQPRELDAVELHAAIADVNAAAPASQEPIQDLNIEGDRQPCSSNGSPAGVTDSSRTEPNKFATLRLPGKMNAPSPPATPRRGAAAGAAATGGDSKTKGKDLTAMIFTKGHTCTLTFSPAKDSLRITRTSSSGKIRTVLNIPVHMVINVETAAEKEERQRMRQTNDEAIKLVFAESGAGAGLMCNCPQGTAAGEEGEPLVFAHSRVNTDASAAGYYGSLFHQASLSSPSMGGNQSISPLATAPTQIRYYVHYMRQRNRERPTIHTLEFLSQGPAELVQTVVNALVQRVYRRGPKHILVFISLKSGKGKGERIFDKHVHPLLHFSRHTYQTYITTRAHDCEDYVANLDNPMNDNTVVTAVGGDGMINEVVNGVHRRKLAMVRWLRSVTTDVGSRGMTEESSQRLGDEGSSSAFGIDPQTLATMSEATSATAVPTKAPNTPEPQAAAKVATIATTRDTNVQQAEENKQERSGAPPPTDAAAVEARRLARVLVEQGWDALMPLIATVATGSACGLAKSLDVLSVAESAMALVHLSTVHMDLLNMSFTPNKEMMDCQRNKLTLKKLTAAQRNFAEYNAKNGAELQERAVAKAEALQRQPPQPQALAHALSAADPTPPFLKDGSNVYMDEVNYALKMPHFDSRVAFMSLSFGSANDIDHGSEPLRWMGNARFHVYGGYMLLLGLRRYNAVLRYLPWHSTTGQTVEKVHARTKMPTAEEFPPCTMREDCPHCQQYTHTHLGHASIASSTHTAEKHTGHTPNTGRRGHSSGGGNSHGGAEDGISAASTLAPYTDAELLDEDTVDFDDPNLPWVTIRGDFCNALLCNVRDVAQDMIMAPLSHMSDGAIDIVYSRIDPCTGKGGRMEMLKFFMGLETGSHVNLDFTNYVKARAVEIKVDAGISMSDGELMPLSSVRLTKLRHSVQLVRNE